ERIVVNDLPIRSDGRCPTTGSIDGLSHWKRPLASHANTRSGVASSSSRNPIGVEAGSDIRDPSLRSLGSEDGTGGALCGGRHSGEVSARPGKDLSGIAPVGRESGTSRLRAGGGRGEPGGGRLSNERGGVGRLARNPGRRPPVFRVSPTPYLGPLPRSIR